MPPAASDPARAVSLAAAAAPLRAVLDTLQLARCGSPELDENLGGALARMIAAGTPADDARAVPGRHCSTDLTDALALLPRDYNFSLGQRDGVFWAWIQPNDQWQPGEYEARHDHPGGSGLVVAYTAALALACAAIHLHLRRAATLLTV